MTSGWRSEELSSRFPPNIPVGEITEASIVEQEAQQQVHLRPFADLRNLDLRPGPDRGFARVILTPKILARLLAIGLLGVLLQLSFFSQVALFHVSPDVLPALVVSLGLLGGSMTGAVSGFSIGLLLDCLLIAPLGGGSLVLLTIGYLAGALPRALRDPRRPGGAAALRARHPLRRARLRRGRADARLRRQRQPAGAPRHPHEEPLRLLPRLADLPRRPPRPAPGPGRGAWRSAAAGRRCWEPRAMFPRPRSDRPARQPAFAAHRRPRRHRRGALRGPLLPALEPAGARRRQVPRARPRTTAPANTG